MNVEDEYFSVIEKRDTTIMLKDKEIAEKSVKLEEQSVKLEEQKIQLEQKKYPDSYIRSNAPQSRYESRKYRF